MTMAPADAVTTKTSKLRQLASSCLRLPSSCAIAAATSSDPSEEGQTLSSIRDMELASSPPLPAKMKSVPRHHCIHLSPGKVFLLQAALIWLVICWPSNVMTFVLYCRIGFSSESSQLQTSLSSNGTNLTLSNDELLMESCLSYNESCQSAALQSWDDCIDTARQKLVLALRENNNSSEEVFLINKLETQILPEIYPCSERKSIPSPDGGKAEEEEEDENVLHLSCHESRERYAGILVWSKFVIEGVLLFIVGIFGIIGNVLTIIVLSKMRTNRNFNKLLTALIVADILLILDLLLEVSVIGEFLREEPHWFVFSYPWFMHPMRGIIQTSSIYMLVGVATERYKSVCNPLAQRHKYYKFIVVAIICSVTLEIPRFFEFKYVSNNVSADYWTTDLMEDPNYIRLNSYWNELLATGGIPLVCLIYMNTRIYLKIRASSKFARKFVGRTRGGSQLTRVSVTQRAISRAGSSTAAQYKKEDSTASTAARRLYSRCQSVPNAALNKSKMTTLDEVAVVLEEGQEMAVVNTEADQRRGSLQPLKQEGWRARSKKLFKRKSSSKEEVPKAPSGIQETSMLISEANTTTVVGSEIPGRFNSMLRTTPSHRGQVVGRRREKSTVILVSIVLIFLICHTYRLSLRLWEISHPESVTLDHYRYCKELGKYHMPIALYIMVNFHHFFLVVNSSVNFIIYCCVGQEFRSKMYQLFNCCGGRRNNGGGE